jgi:hypothetical protein
MKTQVQTPLLLEKNKKKRKNPEGNNNKREHFSCSARQQDGLFVFPGYLFSF